MSLLSPKGVDKLPTEEAAEIDREQVEAGVPVMTKERFFEIQREYFKDEGYIQELWDSRPTDRLEEERLRRTSESVFRRF